MGAKMGLRALARSRRGVGYALVVWAFALLWFAPVIWMLVTSFKPTSVAISELPPRWFPSPATLENYRIVMDPAGGIPLFRAFLTSLAVATVYTALTIVLSVPAAYALARLRFIGREVIYWAYVVALALPASLFLVPHYSMMAAIGLLDNLAALILPGLGGSFGVFLLRQYMLGIPRELDDAASVDGCSPLRFLVAVVIPLVKPSILVLGLMSFLASWNALLWPLLVLNTPSRLTLPIALLRFIAPWSDLLRGVGPLMSGAFLAVGPVLVLFTFFHRYLMQGISFGIEK